jgi:hypothetical protein
MEQVRPGRLFLSETRVYTFQTRALFFPIDNNTAGIVEQRIGQTSSKVIAFDLFEKTGRA